MLGLLKCPECGASMQRIYGSKHETYYECIECGYGELMEKNDYDSNQYFEDDFIEDDESYESEENIDSYDNLIEDGFDY